MVSAITTDKRGWTTILWMICGMLILQIKADPILVYCFEAKAANNQKGLMYSITKTPLQLMLIRKDLHLIHLAGVGSLHDTKIGKWRVAREASLSEICLVFIETHGRIFFWSQRTRRVEGFASCHEWTAAKVWLVRVLKGIWRGLLPMSLYREFCPPSSKSIGHTDLIILKAFSSSFFKRLQEGAQCHLPIQRF
jgi:hypothetical protein